MQVEVAFQDQPSDLLRESPWAFPQVDHQQLGVATDGMKQVGEQAAGEVGVAAVVLVLAAAEAD